MSIKLTMTCGPYDRARALIDGTVKPEGIDLDVYVNKDPGPAYKNQMAGNSILPSFTPAFISPTCSTNRWATRRFPFSSNGCFAILISTSISAPASALPLT